MLSFKQVHERILTALRCNQQVNVFICHSNLHALQALSLQDQSLNIALCSASVSRSFFQQHFAGEIILIDDSAAFSRQDLYAVVKIFNKKWQSLAVFLGNKHNLWSTYILNCFPTKAINILDDGLSSYGISEELYWEKNPCKRFVKQLIYTVSRCFGMSYFHESNNAEIDRPCCGYYFYPDLIDTNPKVKKILLDVEKFKSYSTLALSVKPHTAYLASYEESKLLLNKTSLDSETVYFLHPRITGISPLLPTEIAVYHAKKVVVGASSLILYLCFVGYKGEFSFNNNQQAENIYKFFHRNR